MLNYHRWLDRMQVIERQFHSSRVYLLLLLAVTFVLGGLSYDVGSQYLQPDTEANQDSLSVYAVQLQEKAKRLAARNLELSVEREANANMQSMFVEQQNAQQALNRELAFYRSIMAPENSADGVAIHGVELAPSLMPRQYRIKIVLTQLQKRKRSLSGRSEITFVGLQDGKQIELKLADLTKDPLRFRFRYFQVLESEFTFPAGFSLSRVKAKVVVPASRWTKGSQTEQEYSSQELLLNEKETGVLLEQNGQVLDNSAQQTDVRGSND